jgi:hypothetical protein
MKLLPLDECMHALILPSPAVALDVCLDAAVMMTGVDQTELKRKK